MFVLTEIRDSETTYRPRPPRLDIESPVCVKHNRIADCYVNVVIPTNPHKYDYAQFQGALLRYPATCTVKRRNAMSIPGRRTEVNAARSCPEATTFNEQIVQRTIAKHTHSITSLAHTALQSDLQRSRRS